MSGRKPSPGIPSNPDGLPVELHCLGFCPFMFAMLTAAVVLELDNFLLSID